VFIDAGGAPVQFAYRNKDRSADEGEHGLKVDRQVGLEPGGIELAQFLEVAAAELDGDIDIAVEHLVTIAWVEGRGDLPLISST
jgi:hypothetical protein